jgi:uncharacterized OsmC-like protein
MEEVVNLTQDDVLDLIREFPIIPLRNKIIITTNVLELEDDEVDLGGNAFSPEQYVLAVGSYSKDIVSPGQKVFLDVESMTVKVNNPDDVYNPVMKISLKPVEVEGKIFGVITEDKIEYLIRG